VLSFISLFSWSLTLAPIDLPLRESMERNTEENALTLSDLEVLLSNQKLPEAICEWGAQEFCTFYCKRQREHSFENCMNGLTILVTIIEGCLDKVRGFCQGIMGGDGTQ
jgi:hypothetical protein